MVGVDVRASAPPSPREPLRGPEGERGPKGDTGEQGPPGDPVELLGGLAPGDALSVDGTGNPTALPVVSRDEVFTLGRYGTVATGIGADHTALLEAFAEEAAELSADGGGATLLCPPGIELRSSGIEFAGRLRIDLQGGALRSTADAATVPLFTGPTAGSSEFELRNGRIITDNRVVEMDLAGGNNFGQMARMADLYVVSTGAAPNSADHFYFSQIDFLVIEKVHSYHADRAFVIESNYAANERSNTQIRIASSFAISCRLGAEFRQLDKAWINLDVNGCGSGMHFVRDNKRVQLSHSHVEHWGDPEFTHDVNGDAFRIDNTTSAQSVALYGCSTLEPRANAVSSLRLTDQGAGTGISNIVVRDSEFARDAALTGYRPLRLGGSVTWDGPWPFARDEVALGTFNVAEWTDVQVRPSRATSVSRNLLPFSRISRPEDLPTGPGTLTVAASAGSTSMHDSRAVALTGGDRYLSVSLAGGWHTLLVQGKAVGDDFYVFVLRPAGSFPFRVQQRLKGELTGQLFRLPFYVPTDDTGAHRVGLYAYGAGSSAEISRIELHHGHVNDLADASARDAYASAAPTTGVYNVGDRVWSTAPASGAAPGWVCTAAPATFTAMAGLA